MIGIIFSCDNNTCQGVDYPVKDDKLKKPTTSLSCTVKVIQAKMKMVKGEVTCSDKNVQAGSQHNDFIFGTGSTNKKKRVALEDESDNEQEEEDEDTELELGSSVTEQQLPVVTGGRGIC